MFRPPQDVLDAVDERDDEQVTLDQMQALMEQSRAAQDEGPGTPLMAGGEEPVDEPSPSMDPRLRDAIDKRNKQQLIAGLLGSFQKVIGAGAAGTGYKPDMTVSNQLAKTAGQGVSDVEKQMKQESSAEKAKREKEQHKQVMDLGRITIAGKQLELTNKEKTSDPNSDESILAQDERIKMLIAAGENPTPEDRAKIRKQSGDSLVATTPALQDKLKQLLTFNRQKILETSRQKFQAGERVGREKFTSDQAELDRAVKKEEEHAKIQKEMDKEDRKEKREKSKLSEKETAQIKKENRKLRTELDSGQSGLEAQLTQLQNAKAAYKDYLKDSWTGTGPIATMGGTSKYLPGGGDTERLDSVFKEVALDVMVKKFAGMSKAVDSDAERRAFEATQANIASRPETNFSILDRQIAATERLIEKTKAAKDMYDRVGRFNDEDVAEPGQIKGENTVVKKGYNAKTNQTQLIYSDGSKEIVEGRQ